MKVYHIISGLYNGGAENLLYNFIENDKKNTHTVISLDGPGYFAPKLEKLGIKLFFINSSNIINIFFSIIKISKIISINRPDVIQTWMYKADFIGGIGAKLSNHKKIYWSLHHSKPITFHIRIYERIIYKILSVLSFYIPNKIIACGTAVSEFHKKIGYCKKKIIIIYNGYNLEKFNLKKDSKYKKFLKLENFLVLGMVARWDKFKDYKTLFIAISKLKSFDYNFKLILAGRDINLKNIKLMNLIKKFNLENQIILLNLIDDIENLYKIFDINLLISHAEGFPNVLAESMLSGTPCIATNVGDNKKIISKYGEVINLEDHNDLLIKLKKLIKKISNSENKSNLANKCNKHIVNNYSLDLMILGYNTIWKA